MSYRKPGWIAKFQNAFRGIAVGIRGQNSFLVHLPVGVLVLVVGWLAKLSSTEYSILILCVAIVLAAELFNSGIESLSRSITSEHDANIRDALDISSGAVLILSLFAILIGLVILFPAIQRIGV